MKEKTIKVVIAATFTAEPLRNYLPFIAENISLPLQWEFAPYNQVLQQLLDPNSLFTSNREGINIVLYRPEDWLRYDTSGQDPQIKIDKYNQELAQAITSYAAKQTPPCFILECPPSPPFQKNPPHPLLEINHLPAIYPLSLETLQTLYPVKDYYEPTRDNLGHAPYTNAMYAALSLYLVRQIHALIHKPYKVVVLDCDNTLWKGECGELGPLGVQITQPYKHLQQFMLDQMQQGMLLTLCSKNTLEDVQAVFETNPNMVLKSEHFVSKEINWKPKSQNLKKLADSLQLSLNSFIFLDDNPVDCAEVQANCPEVLTLQLPDKSENITSFLHHLWAFDRLSVTDEDRTRTALYQQEKKRQEFSKTHETFDDFIRELHLEIDFLDITAENMTRVAQLTQRTTQFNSSSIIRSEAEIRQFCTQPNHKGLGISVKDRFGEYGLVGVVLMRSQKTDLIIDTLLLSCRVLGRGVEHRIMQKLGEIATQKNAKTISFPVVETARNEPIRNFLQKVSSTPPTNKTYIFDPTHAKQIQFKAEEKKLEKTPSKLPTNTKSNSDQYMLMATRYSSPTAILEAKTHL